MKITQIINELNVIDQEPVDKYLNQFESRTPAIANWLKTKAKTYILNSERDMTSIDPDSIDLTQAPSWLKTAVERGDELYEFDPSQELKQEIEHILDYLNSDAFDQHSKLNRISFAQAKQMSDNWHHQLANPSKKELERRKKRQLDDSDLVKTIYKFKDGYRIVELTNDACKTREGELMGHCVGGGNYRDKTILSLRDTSNEPHATMEISNTNPFLIVQLQGKANQDVVEKYWPYMSEFLRKTDYHLEPQFLRKIGLVEIEGEIYEINNMPDGLKVGGSLDLSRAIITHLPDGLKVGGSLNLHNSNITQLPDDLAVSGSLYLSNTKITQLPEKLTVSGSLDLRNSKITHLPDDLTVGKDLYLSRTPITHLPDGLKVGGGLDLSNTKITHLPDDLVVDGDLDLKDSKITQLPEGLKVGGSLYLTNTPITHLPDGLKVGESLYLSNTPITRLPENLTVGRSLDLYDSNITQLPEGLKVVGYLYLSNTKITQLPDGLTIGGDLYLSNTPITHLPDGLKVGGSLYLSNTKITHLPDDLIVHGEVYYDNTGITREEYNRWESSQR
jgi:hypothetical protein